MQLRSFIAFSLKEETLNWLENCVDQLKATDKQGEIRWTPTDNFHLTLSFLDNIEEHYIEPLGHQLAKVLAGEKSLTVEINEVGYAPFMPRSKFVVANVVSHPELSRIQKKVEQAARTVGISLPKKNFKPHITIGRARSRGGAKLVIPPRMTKEIIHLDCIRVYESALRPEGACYDPLVEIELES